MDNQELKCWGVVAEGHLGYPGAEDALGDDEFVADLDSVDVGEDVLQVGGGYIHTCAALSTGKLRCWGYGGYGALGYGTSENIGDDESPDQAGDISVGSTVSSVG